MSPLSVTRGMSDGFETVLVDTGGLSLCLVPELGGKITSLRDLHSGREWLWRNLRMPYQVAEPNTSYVAVADTGGWDECFPTVAPCDYPTAPWAGAALPDHGELWSQRPALDMNVGADTVSLNTRWQGAALPYRFERQVRATAGSASLRVDYTIANMAMRRCNLSGACIRCWPLSRVCSCVCRRRRTSTAGAACPFPAWPTMACGSRFAWAATI